MFRQASAKSNQSKKSAVKKSPGTTEASYEAINDQGRDAPGRGFGDHSYAHARCVRNILMLLKRMRQ
jgi:hypothetical protein